LAALPHAASTPDKTTTRVGSTDAGRRELRANTPRP
jgi:hypothetical protein